MTPGYLGFQVSSFADRAGPVGQELCEGDVILFQGCSRIVVQIVNSFKVGARRRDEIQGKV